MRKGSRWKKYFQNYYNIELLTIQPHYFSAFPTLASGASIARGSPRTIGQKPEPTICRGTAHESLPPGGRGTAIAVEGARVTFSLHGFYCYALPLSRLRRQLPPGGSLWMCVTLGVWALPEAGVACNAVIQRRNWR